MLSKTPDNFNAHRVCLQCRLASLDDLEPLQQLTKLTQLGTDGNACCNLHPISRFRIEVLARHSANLQQIDSHKVGHNPLGYTGILHTG